jgi:triacylglycerol esterase/lipase EstA (alpha/beta hydrolase family)
MIPIYIKTSNINLHLDKKDSLFNESAPSYSKYISVKFNDYKIEGRKLSTDKNMKHSKKCLFSIHGARSNYNSLNPILYPLQILGIPSLSFNLSGHSTTSQINIKVTSLKENLQESLYFLNSKNISIRNILGFSLGGALALKIAEVNKDSVKRIVLLAPALYTEEAYKVPFGPFFKETISMPFSFLDSKSLSFLKEYKGKVLLIIGEYDGLSAKKFDRVEGTSVGNITFRDNKSYYSPIPYEVVEALEKSIPLNNFQKIILKGCDHSIMQWLRDNPDVAQQLSQEIASFLE